MFGLLYISNHLTTMSPLVRPSSGVLCGTDGLLVLLLLVPPSLLMVILLAAELPPLLGGAVVAASVPATFSSFSFLSLILVGCSFCGNNRKLATRVNRMLN